MTGYWGLNEICAELENPYGEDSNDIDNLKVDFEVVENIISGVLSSCNNILTNLFGSITRNIDINLVPYIKGDTYTKDEFSTLNIAHLNDPYILRDFRGQVLQINPFQYNPITKQLTVYNRLNIRIDFSEENDINILVNNAGVSGSPEGLGSITYESFMRMLAVNMGGTFICTQAALPLMNSGGSIVNLSSIAGLAGWGPVHYASAKGAILGITRASASELG